MKATRPPVSFPRYRAEPTATVVEDRPWFEHQALLAETKPLLAIGQEATEAKPRVPRPEPKALPKTPSVMEPAFRRAVGFSAQQEITATTALRPMLTAVGVPERTAPTAPAWVLPEVPTVAAPAVERRELPSFGPVAFDLDPGMTARISYKPEQRPLALRASPMVVGVACLLATLGGLAGRLMTSNQLTIAPATATAPLAVETEIRAQAPAPAEVAPAVEAIELDAPVAPSPSPPPLPVAEAAPEGAKLTPEQIFAPASPSAPKPLAKVPPPTRAELAALKIQRARIAADLARRNAPAPVMIVRNGRSMPAPSVEDVLRTPRLRGERD